MTAEVNARILLEQIVIVYFSILTAMEQNSWVAICVILFKRGFVIRHVIRWASKFKSKSVILNKSIRFSPTHGPN